MAHEKGKLRYQCAEQAVTYRVLANDTRRAVEMIKALGLFPVGKGLPLAKDIASDLSASLDRPPLRDISTQLKTKIKDAIKEGLDDAEDTNDILYHISNLPEEIIDHLIVTIADCECGS